MTSVEGGNGVRADLDGIRALGELSRRQAGHVGNIDGYLHDTCEASGAFKGVMTFFHGTYSAVVRAASEGLGGARRTHEKAAQNFDETATTYEAADRGSYDFLARIAGPAGWDIDPYRAAGSGDSKIGLGACVAAATHADPGSDPEQASFGDKAEERGIEEIKGLPARLTRETVLVDGRRVFKDDLPEGFQGIDGPDAIGKTEGVLDRINDPLGIGKKIDDAKSGLTDRMVDGFHEHGGKAGDWTQRGKYQLDQAPNAVGAGAIKDDAHHSYQQHAELHANVREVAGWYDGIPDAKDYVEGLAHDPTGGVGDSVKEFTGAVDDVMDLKHIGDKQADTSALDWGRR